MALPFKAVVVDMDGTFLDDRKKYDQSAFASLLKRLRRRKIHFIVASGRPYARLAKDFAPFKQEMSFVCLNGSLLVRDEKIVATYPLLRPDAMSLIKEVEQKYGSVSTTVFASRRAYFLCERSQKEKDFLTYFAVAKEELASWQDLPQEQILQVTFGMDSRRSRAIAASFNKKHQHKVAAFASSSMAIDITQQKINKAAGLKILLSKLGITPQELIAFGDGGNDLQMLALAKYSYAMANATKEVKKRARYLAPSNNDKGVLRVLQKYLNEDSRL